jgi:cytochrome c oxidase subunit 2
MPVVPAPVPVWPTLLRATLLCGVTLAASMTGARALAALLHVGPLSLHMIEHMALLGVAAPMSAFALRQIPIRWTGGRLALAFSAQIAMLWLWHLPPIFSAAADDGLLHFGMSGSLYLVGVSFWSAVQGTRTDHRWQSVVALLLTGKLFCLFAAILVFSPRVLYAFAVPAHHAHGALSLEDQQLAGLIMLTVCPLTYVAAGIAIAAQWIAELDRRAHSAPWMRGAANAVAFIMMVPLVSLLGGCAGVQSALAPASPQAESAFALTLTLFVGATIIFLLVLLVLGIALFADQQARAWIGSNRTVIVGGVAFPLVVLTILLGYGLWLMRVDAQSAAAAHEIDLQGERWWWRVTYRDHEVGPIASANEVRLEAGRPVRIRLTSTNVIHSFWVPSLAGKVDLIPGRTNEIVFTPTSAGVYRGQCAEYCGGAHALMGLRVVVMEATAYARWRQHIRAASVAPTDPQRQRGRELFVAACIGCHTVRGTIAGGRLGPDLTHVGSRAAIAAETLPMSQENLARWIAHNSQLKPGNLMPDYAGYAREDVEALAAYLASLK